MPHPVLSIPPLTYLLGRAEQNRTLPELNRKQDLSYNQDSNLFNLTAAILESEEGFQLRKEYMLQKQQQQKQRKSKNDNVNPFENPELWQTVMNSVLKGESQVSLPNIGIQKTPLFLMSQAEAQKNQKKDDLRKRIQRGDFLGIKKQKIKIENIVKFPGSTQILITSHTLTNKKCVL